ncbi:hypothetical protein SCUCBS95973_001929 [Sporothrix curviconia]|uniref:DUF7924 domain-containing protein n=1 Tax=Sporothrix curviconia TaxID=1260050 RepID=A0ABP0B2R4_9PEZI
MAGVRRDADGFVIPPQRTSSRRQSAASDSASLMSDGMSVSGGGVSGAGASSSGSRRPSLVERGRYRVYNLYLNGIQFRDKAVAFPPSIARLIADMGRNRAERGDAGRPTKDELWNNKKLGGLEMGAEEPVVEDYFKEALFPDSDFEKGLMRATRQPMVRGRTPGRSQLAKVSNPIPDLLYGYSDTCFVAHAAGYSTVVDNVTANNQDMSLPFLAVEFKGDGPGGTGSLWVATNQCLGDSAACVNMAEHVFKKGREKAGTANTERDKDERTAHSAAFSIAMNGTEARLYVTWVVDGEGDGVFCMQKVDSFLMQKPADYLAFRDYVLNIVDWGQTTRLERFRAIFDMLSS